MASTFQELYSDFQQSASLYIEKVPMTDVQFMRYLAKGMKRLNTRAKLIQTTKQLVSTDSYDLGSDVLSIIMILDSSGREIISQATPQMQGQKEDSEGGYYHESPRVWSLTKDNQYWIDQWGADSRVYSRHDNKIVVYPALSSTTEELTLYYELDVEEFSEASTQWADFYPLDTNFATEFATKTMVDVLVNPEVARYEHGCVAFALSEWLKSRRNQDWQVYLGEFNDTVAQAIDNKQQHFKEGASPYRMSPYS